MPKRKSGAGRPSLPPGQKADERVNVNFKPEQMEKVNKAAKLEGFEKTGTWLREVAVAAADEALARKKNGGK